MDVLLKFVRQQQIPNNKQNPKIAMVQKTQTNLLLIGLNIIVLSLFLYPLPAWTLPIYLALAQTNLLTDIKKKMQLVSIFSLMASFFVYPWATDFFAACALGLAINVGYRIDSHNAPCWINCCLGVGIILGYFSGHHLAKYQTARDMAILVCTLPNLFMAQDLVEKQGNQTLWFFSPIYDRAMTYSFGFIAGVFLPLSTINKPIRFLIISLILLMTIFVQGSIYQDILSLLRGVFIYDEKRHKAELYFLIGYILIDIIASDYKFNYLFVGYLVISVMLWHREEYLPELRERRPVEKPLLTQLQPVQYQHQQSQSD